VRVSYFGDTTCPSCGSLLWPRHPVEQTARRARRWLTNCGARLKIDSVNRSWRVDLNGIEIGPVEIEGIVDLRHVSELIVEWSVIDRHAISKFGQLIQLEVAEFVETGLTDYDLAFLSNLDALQVLSLAGNPVSDNILFEIQKLREVYCLDLNQTAVIGDSFGRCKFLPKLELLFLDGTQVGDDSQLWMYRLPKLKLLSIRNTKVSDKMVRKLKRLYPKSRVKT